MPHDPAHSAKPTSVGHRHWMFTSAVGTLLSRCTDAQIDDRWTKAAAIRTADNLAPDLPSFATLLTKAADVRARGYAVRIATRADLDVDAGGIVLEGNTGAQVMRPGQRSTGCVG